MSEPLDGFEEEVKIASATASGNKRGKLEKADNIIHFATEGILHGPSGYSRYPRGDGRGEKLAIACADANGRDRRLPGGGGHGIPRRSQPPSRSASNSTTVTSARSWKSGVRTRELSSYLTAGLRPLSSV